MRKLFYKIHLWLSIPLGLLFSVICFSGAALVFEKEITQWVRGDVAEARTVAGEQRQQQAPPATAGAQAMQPEARKGEAQHAAQPSAGTRSPEAQQQGRPSSSVKGGPGGHRQPPLPFFKTMRQLHRWLLNPPPQKGMKSVGKVIVGVSTLLMVFVLVSGIFIWVPRTKRALKNRLCIATDKGIRRFWYDSHVALGIYVVIFLLIMALTGLTWSFGWYRTAFYALFDNPGKGFVYGLHTGAWGGITTKVIYFISSFIGGVLPLSGYYLWWKKRK